MCFICIYAICLTHNVSDNIQLKKIDINLSTTEINAYGAKVPFNIKSIISSDNKYNTIIFKGRIINLEEYEISWTDDNNEHWGPFSRTIITVETNNIYHGALPTKSNQIKILYPHSLSMVYDDSVRIELNKEYIFANCWIIDGKYEEQAKNSNIDFYSYDKTLNIADAVMGGAWNSLLPIEDDTIIIHNEYFNSLTNANIKVLPYNETNATRLTNKNSLKNGSYIAVNFEIFEKEFINLIDSYT